MESRLLALIANTHKKLHVCVLSFDIIPRMHACYICPSKEGSIWLRRERRDSNPPICGRKEHIQVYSNDKHPGIGW